MEDLVIDRDQLAGVAFGGSYREKKVLVTGHTGFKGSWITEWLLMLGATVTGISLDPPTDPSLFQQLGISNRINSIRADVRDLGNLIEIFDVNRPDYIFHLAAQPLVRRSYSLPVETFEINLLGSVNVMEAVRRTGHSCAVVMVSSDKCYENREWLHPYREEDSMGGHDPYSASKGCAEIAISSFRRSFFSPANRLNREKKFRVALASARAGNVIGGGDWAPDRIVPDCVRAIQAGLAVAVRNKTATRPWQHVLEPLSGYLLLGACLMRAIKDYPGKSENIDLDRLCSGFNFGPMLDSNRSVAELVQEVLKHWTGEWIDKSDPNALHEAGRLNLGIDKAFHMMGWRPVWTFEETVNQTVMWYKNAHSDGIGNNDRILEFTRQQIEAYCQRARQLNLSWMS
jgi:CDP-glucose 4,6-dehydratase